jgi:hypothetical protein
MSDMWSAWKAVVVLVIGTAVAGVGSSAAAARESAAPVAVGTVVVREVVGDGPNGVGLLVQAPGVERRICVRFSGSTVSGADVLRRAGVDPVFSAMGNGLAVCAMCGVGCEGGSGCLTCQQPDHWSYWRATAGSSAFSFSPVGVSSVRAAHGDVEGWRFGTGDAAPTLVPFEQICTGMVVVGSPATVIPTTVAPLGPGPTAAPDTSNSVPAAPSEPSPVPTASVTVAVPPPVVAATPTTGAPTTVRSTPVGTPTTVLMGAGDPAAAPVPSLAADSSPSASAASSDAAGLVATTAAVVTSTTERLEPAAEDADAAEAAGVPVVGGGGAGDSGSGGAATAAGIAVAGVLVGGAALVGRSRRRAQLLAG